MAKYRQVHTHMWKDSWFLDLEPIHKLFFIYLFTNERASISGIYELSKRVMMFESGLTASEIDAGFEAFESNKKAFYSDGVVWVVNLRKYHETKSPKIQKAIEDDVFRIKDCELKRIYCQAYGMDRVFLDENRVEIPRSSSSISSSDSSGFDTISGFAPEVTETSLNGQLDDMITAIASVVRETYAIGVTDSKFDGAAQAFVKRGITPSQVKAFNDYWRRMDDRPYQGKPYLKTLVNNIGESIGNNGVDIDSMEFEYLE